MPVANRPQLAKIAAGWRGIILVAITYVYFLIFAQFAFIRRLSDLGIADAHLKLVMAAMALGGILLSLQAPIWMRAVSATIRLRIALLLCALAALITLTPLSLSAAVAAALFIGCSLGLLTVTLVTHLRQWLAPDEPLLQVAVGTGLGYFLCNLPIVFTAAAQMQAGFAATLCLFGICVTGLTPASSNTERAAAINVTNHLTPSFFRVLLCFTALVWFDSAAFFIIQSTPALKAGTWQGTLHLWTNGVLHFVAALASAWLLCRRSMSYVLAIAFFFLASAGLLLAHPSGVAAASALYPVGVSLYSVALVAYPSLLAPAGSLNARGRMAGWIYAVAGWIGSALGIGMAQNLGRVPVSFIAVAGAAIVGPLLPMFLRRRHREILSTSGLLITAFIASRLLTPAPRPVTANTLSNAQQGRQVYISEGCIHCHSQYVRPGTRDEVLWGPAQSVTKLRNETPPLIGNRRQGSDLSQVGRRRSPLWLKMHLVEPRALIPGSFMPSYAYLFQSSRGNDLVSYLTTLGGGDITDHQAAEKVPNPEQLSSVDSSGGKDLYKQYCATCHAADGATRVRWHDDFRRLPPAFPDGPWRYLPADPTDPRWSATLTRIIRFGIPGTDMAGHEYLPANQVAAIDEWLTKSVITSRAAHSPVPQNSALRNQPALSAY